MCNLPYDIAAIVDKGPEPNVAAIIGGVIAAVVGIVILIVAIVFLRRWIGKLIKIVLNS